ncbi:MAG: undecaprenyl pyrophosphate synthase [Symbiobacteriaceae bacterium]|nr:undecaprenyl pyrophosphate synthase [Symbiobacteriaceae bacterium]
MLENLRRLVGLNHESAPAPAKVPAPAGGPRHVGVIMDGNGRWAQRRGLPRTAGHKAGVEALRAVVKACPDLGIEVLTAYAFSTENWTRPKDEVDFLMYLIVEYCRREVNTLNENGVRINAIGRIDELPALQRDEIYQAMEKTRHNTRLVLNLAVNYGGHAELVDTMRAIAAEVAAGKVRPEEINEDLIRTHLYTAGLPELDLVIRTAGEMRLSNFMLWQASYSEFWVTDVAWPDVTREVLEQAVLEYKRRDRRFGTVLQQSR